ncbi:MAG: efflux RND transporter permease subunit [Desulfobacterales bacterium]
MSIAQFSVSRRTTVTMFILIITLFGLLSFSNLGLDMLPELEFPFVSVVTGYEGVASEEIETLLTKPIEESVGMVKGIKNITSRSSEGISSVYIEFEWGTDLDVAAQDVRDSLSWVVDYLPDDSDTPMVLKFNSSSMPIMEYGVTGIDDTIRLREYLDKTVKPRLERLDGIAAAFIFGGKEREIQVLADPNKLKATGLSLNDLSLAVQSGNLNVSGGHIQTFQKEYLVRTQGYFESARQIENTVVSITDQNKPVYIKDVAIVHDTFKEKKGFENTNRNPAVLIDVFKQSGFNTLEAVNNVKAELKKMEKDIPSELEFRLTFDQGNFIERSISSTGETALWGGLIALIVVFIFLRAVRPTIAIAIAIPLSVIATFIGMEALDYTFNIMTLGGIALGVGLLVDNAVVVIENTFRHLESGKPRNEAAVIGTHEVGLAITASTFTTMAVFLPLSLSQSIAGKLARPLSLTVCISLLASLLVAVTIIPAIAATIFKQEKTDYGKARRSGWVGAIQKGYTAVLRRVLKLRWPVLFSALAVLVVSVFMTPLLGTEFMPREDVPIGRLNITLPEGSVLEETKHISDQIARMFMSKEEIETCLSFGGITAGAKFQAAMGDRLDAVNNATIFARFKEREDRNRSTDDVLNEIREQLPDLEGVDYNFVDMAGFFFGTGDSPIEINLYGPDLEILDDLSVELMDRLSPIEGLEDIERSLKKRQPEFHVIVDREKASKMGLSVHQIAVTVETAVLGRVISRYHDGGDEYDIRVRLQAPYRKSFENLFGLTIQSPLGFTVPLYQVTSLQQEFGPSAINRKNQDRVVTITGTNFNRDLGGIVGEIQSVLGSLTLPERFSYEIAGTFEDMQTSFEELTKAFIVAVILIYMIMAAQFESLTQPLIVMFTMPLAYSGVVFGLLLTGKTLSVPAFMGLIILMGIVVNNGIVMIDYINRLRKNGMEKFDAIVEGASVRIRPILITSVTTICGVLPMAFSGGDGSAMRSPLAVAVAFGLAVAMLLTLFVVPSAYYIVDSMSAKFRSKTADTL